MSLCHRGGGRLKALNFNQAFVLPMIFIISLRDNVFSVLCRLCVQWGLLLFLQHKEFSFQLKEKVCPLVIKLFSPSLKYRQGMPPPPSPTPVERPFFPIVMRLLRIVCALIKHYYCILVSLWPIFNCLVTWRQQILKSLCVNQFSVVDIRVMW